MVNVCLDANVQKNLVVTNHNIIEKFCEKISPLVKDFPEDDPLMFVQVKEKFGTLRIYMTHYNELIDEATKEAEEASAITCEECGEPGSYRDDRYWKVTECDECHKNGNRRKRLLKEFEIKESE